MLDDIPLILRGNMWLQLYGAPVHSGRIVVNWLNVPNRSIGKQGSIPWAARAPDLIPLDFSIWSIIKNYVYKIQINSEEQLIVV